MKNPTPYEIRKFLDECGRAGFLLQVPNFSPEAQELSFQVIEQVENDKFEQSKLEIRKEANQIASAANKRAGISLWVSFIACTFSVLSFLENYFSR